MVQHTLGDLENAAHGAAHTRRLREHSTWCSTIGLALLNSALFSLYAAQLNEWPTDDLMARHTENELCSTYAQLRLFIIINSYKN